MVAGNRIIHPRLEVIRSDDATVVDLTDWASSVEVELGDVSGIGTGSTGGDGVVRQMRFRLHNQTDQGRFSPLDQSSSWNQFGGQYDPLLWPNRQAIFYVAVQEVGESVPVFPDDYYVLFQGYIGDEIRTTGPFVECELRDLAKRLQDTFIETNRIYAESEWVPVEQVMQQIINDNVSVAPPSIYVPASIGGRDVKGYVTEWQSVWDALQDLAAQSALWLGYRFDPGARQFRLTLLEPPRDKTTPDFVLDWRDDFYLHELDITDRNVRNAIVVEFRREEDGARERVVRESSASIAEFGRRAMQIEEGATSIIQTTEQAERFAESAINDLSDLTSTTRIDMPLRPDMDVFAGLEVNDPRIAETKFYGVESVRHTLDFDGGKFRTAVVCAGRVVGARRRWMQIQARPGAVGEPTPNDFPVRTNTVLTVAASDAPKEVKRRADIVCDGLDDHVQIQAAIDRVAGEGGIGKVVLSEGTFNVGKEINMPSNTVLQGQGSVTVLRVVNDAEMGIVVTNSDWDGNENVTLTDFAIDGNKEGQPGTQDYFQTGVFFSFCEDFAVRRLTIYDMMFDGIGVTEFSNNGQIDQCDIYRCDASGIYVGDCGGLTLSGNTVRENGLDGIQLAVAWDCTLVGNPVSENKGPGIRLEFSNSCTVTGNTVSLNLEEGIVIGGQNAQNGTISANTVRENGHHGIRLTNEASSNVVADNNCDANGTASPNTYDNICIDDGAKKNDIQGNVCRSGIGGQVRYGIGVAQDAGDDNFVTNNDLLDAGDSADLWVGNESTVTAPGNRTTAGSGGGGGGGFRVRRDSDFEFASGVHVLQWNVVDLDTDGMHPNPGQLSPRLIVQKSGIYQLTSSVRVNPSPINHSATYRFRIKANAFTIVEEYKELDTNEGFPRSFMVTAAWPLEEGDEVSVEIERVVNATSPNTVAAVSTITPIFTGVRVG